MNNLNHIVCLRPHTHLIQKALFIQVAMHVNCRMGREDHLADLTLNLIQHKSLVK